MSSLRIVSVTNTQGHIIDRRLLASALSVHRQLRPHLPATEEEYLKTLERVCSGGARILLALLDNTVAGIAVYRITDNTFRGHHLYVDDLITSAEHRSHGIGSKLIAQCEAVARADKCTTLVLDSGTQRENAHRFYFREGLTISAFNFHRKVKHCDSHL